MSRALRIILVLYLVAVATLCLYVPWMFTLEPGMRVSLGYGALWDPQDLYAVAGQQPPRASVDLERVFLELLAVSALAGAAVVLFGYPHGDQP